MRVERQFQMLAQARSRGGLAPERSAELENFIAFAAHDLRAPIGQIQTLAEMIAEDFVDMGDGKLELLEHLVEVVQTSYHVLTDVLDYAETAQTELPEEAFSLQDLCAQQARMLDCKGRLALQVPDVSICADKVSLGIVLRNLMDNALRYGSTGKIAVSVLLQHIPGGFLQFDIRDNGHGFDDPASVFDWKPKVQRTGGYGLRGLKRMIEGRGGTINAVAPRNGSGAHIRLSFPGRVCTS